MRRLFRIRLHRNLVVLLAGAVLACGGGGGGSAPSATGMPQDVNAAPGNGLVTVTWTAVEGATSYNVYWATTPSVTVASGTKLASVSSPYSHTSLTNGTAYYYVVTAVGAGGESAVSAEVNAKPTAGSVANPSGIAGTVTYQYVPSTKTGTLEFANAVLKPVRNATVRVMQGTTVCATGVTDETGYYSIDFTSCSTGQLSVNVLAQTTTPAIQVEDNTNGNAVWGITSNFDSSTHVLDMTAVHGWTGSSYDAAHRAAAPFAILDSMYTAAHAFIAVRPTVAFPPLRVNWSPDNIPQPGDKTLGQIGTSHYSPSENEIYILGKDGVDTDEFDNHVIAHEWGHYFEHNLSRSDSIGGSHGAGDALDPRLAFGEGYGNAIAAMGLHGTRYVDTYWSGGTLKAFGFDAETVPSPTDDPSPGPFSEMSLLRLLYDLYDTGSSESYDQTAVGLGVIYDVLAGPEKTTYALTTIASFITGLKAQSGVDATAVNAILAHHGIGAISDEWGTGDSNLEGIFTLLTPNSGSGVHYPFTFSTPDTESYWDNKRVRNQYFRFQGNGSDVTLSTHCSEDVDVYVYLQGVEKAYAETDSGNETVTVSSTENGKWYVAWVNGYSDAVSYSGYVTSP